MRSENNYRKKQNNLEIRLTIDRWRIFLFKLYKIHREYNTETLEGYHTYKPIFFCYNKRKNAFTTDEIQQQGGGEKNGKEKNAVY